jgi:hypothetical protein
VVVSKEKKERKKDVAGDGGAHCNGLWLPVPVVLLSPFTQRLHTGCTMPQQHSHRHSQVHRVWQVLQGAVWMLCHDASAIVLFFKSATVCVW